MSFSSCVPTILSKLARPTLALRMQYQECGHKEWSNALVEAGLLESLYNQH